MARNQNQKSFLVILSVISIVISLTYLISVLARGYQPDFDNGFKLKATGLLSATSKPKSASVFINNRLYTVTDDTINLTPGQYQVKIIKDGYFPWSKNIEIKKEMVFQTEATLFRAAPDFRPLILNTALNPAISSDRNSIVFAVASASSEKDNGIYLIENYGLPLPLPKNSPKLLFSNTPNINWSNFDFSFSPNSKQILAKSRLKNITYLISLDQISNPKNLIDISNTISIIEKDWEKQLTQTIISKLDRLPPTIKPLVSTKSADILFSSDDSKVLYLTQSNTYFVHDFVDNKNYLIGSPKDILNPFWLPNSNNLIFTDQNQQIKSIEYDASNLITIFSGKFAKDIISPHQDGNKIIIYTQPFPHAQQNLYSVSIR